MEEPFVNRFTPPVISITMCEEKGILLSVETRIL